jgi:formamidopyrimidine-DNA glycosylase
MPELPEIETICKGLKSKILNKVIVNALKLTKFNLRRAIPTDIELKLKNRKILAVERRAKYINIHLDDNLIILIHLGMSGKLLLKDKNYSYQKHDHFVMQLNDGEQLVYNDPRRFGLIELCDGDKLEECDLLSHLGAEPLSDEFTVSKFAEVLKGKKQPIKLSIMDNYNIVGVGNIYASESLYLSKILPTRASASLNLNEVSLLHDKIIEVLNNAIKQGGSTLKDYASVSGEKGYFQNSFKVYGKEGKECIMCGCLIEKIKQAGRASFYCPKCQH